MPSHDMPGDLTADEIRKLLDLAPNATCGFVRVTFLEDKAIAPGGLPAPFADGRPLGSALYFLVTPTVPVRLLSQKFFCLRIGFELEFDKRLHYLSPHLGCLTS
jgi:hypothetical protein